MRIGAPTHALPVYNGTPAPQLMLGHKDCITKKIRARKSPRNSASSTILDHRESCDKFIVLTTLYETPLLKIALAGFVNSQWNSGFTSRLCISKNKSIQLCRYQSNSVSASTASARSQCSPSDPNSKLRSRAIPAEPQLQALDGSVPRQTRTASSGSQCSQPDLDHKESSKI